MTRIPTSLMAAGLALAATLALAACDDRRDDAAIDDAANPPPAATEPPPADMPDADGDGMPDADTDAGVMVDADAAVSITSVELGNEVGADNRVPAPMSTFATTDTVHASVVTNGTGGTVSTRWTFEDGQVVHTEDKIVPAGEQVTDFMITNPSGWPAGTYTLDVMVDGNVVQTREFEVR